MDRPFRPRGPFRPGDILGLSGPLADWAGPKLQPRKTSPNQQPRKTRATRAVEAFGENADILRRRDALYRRCDGPRSLKGWQRWLWLGIHLSASEPEFNAPKPKRGRPRVKAEKRAGRNDLKILKAARERAREDNLEFGKALSQVVRELEGKGELRAADRTTHLKRIRALDKAIWRDRASELAESMARQGTLNPSKK